jgi:hypothetical protein
VDDAGNQIKIQPGSAISMWKVFVGRYSGANGRLTAVKNGHSWATTVNGN